MAEQQNLPADEGRLAYQGRKTPDDNPYTEDDWRHQEWWFGWNAAEECDQDDLYDWSTGQFK